MIIGDDIQTHPVRRLINTGSAARLYSSEHTADYYILLDKAGTADALRGRRPEARAKADQCAACGPALDSHNNLFAVFHSQLRWCDLTATSTCIRQVLDDAGTAAGARSCCCPGVPLSRRLRL